MKLVIGLGNPGKKYINTRHNVGFRIIDLMVGDIKKYKKKFNSKYYIDNDKNIIFLKPETYMNLSGEAVSNFMNYYKITSENIIVIHDDKDINFQHLKIKMGGSSGGHNGIKNIIECLKTEKFLRIKIGILNPSCNKIIDFVLEDFTDNEKQIIDKEIFLKIKNIIFDFSLNKAEYLMNKYNGLK